jgi:hypothetical protein
MKPRLILLSAVAAAMLAAPALSSAATYCVGSPPGCTGINKSNNLQGALDDALASSTTADQIEIGPAGSPYTRSGGFKYLGASSVNPVEIMGVGSPTPTLTMTSDHVGSYQFVLNVNQGNSMVHDLNFTIPNEDNPAGLNMTGGTVQRVNVTNPLSCVCGTGILISGGTVEDSTFDMGTSGYGVDVRAGTTTPILAQDNTITAGHGFEITSGGAPVHVTRNRISSSYIGVQIYGGDAQLDNTLIDLRGASGTWGIYATRYPGNNDVDLDARELTIRNGGSNAKGVEEESGNANTNIAVTLTDSIIRDVAHSIVQQAPPASSTFTFTADHDDYDQSTNQGTVDSSTVFRTETNMLNVDPLFVNPISGAGGISGDYRLAPGSPLIDAGSSTPLDPGETDLAGQPRIVAGLSACGTAVRDIGAYEFQTTCSVPSQPSQPSTASPTGQQAAALKKCKKIKNPAKRRKCKRRARRLPL